MQDSDIMRVSHLSKRFYHKRLFGKGSPAVKAVDDVSFSLKRGEVFVLAGESGSGKSTIAKMILRSVVPDSGEVIFDGRTISGDKGSLKMIRMNCQMIHQDPYDSINPRMKVMDIVAEPLEIHKMGDAGEIRRRVIEVLGEVRLEPAEDIAGKYPHMLSGGQKQRVVLARALTTKPSVILADEPVSMLDVSIRAEMLELLRDLQKRHGISFIYITHDLSTARHFGQRIGILYRGRLVEVGSIDEVLSDPAHPYTQALIDAVSEPDPANLHRDKTIRINEPDPNGAVGCRFSDRCQYVIEKCATEPVLEEDAGHQAACHARLDQA